MAGFSVETSLGVLSKINTGDPLKPLIDNIASGNIYGVVLLAGCISPKVTAYASHVTIAGLLTPEATEKYAGNKLKSVLIVLGETAGIEKPLPPVWHLYRLYGISEAVLITQEWSFLSLLLPKNWASR